MKLIPYTIGKYNGLRIPCYTPKEFALERHAWMVKDGKRIADPLAAFPKMSRQASYLVYLRILEAFYSILIDRLFRDHDTYFNRIRLSVRSYGRYNIKYIKYGGRLPNVTALGRKYMVILGMKGVAIREKYLNMNKTYPPCQ
jgi:hypothetical protein